MKGKFNITLKRNFSLVFYRKAILKTEVESHFSVKLQEFSQQIY